jgi:hypothetical protein
MRDIEVCIGPVNALRVSLPAPALFAGTASKADQEPR